MKREWMDYPRDIEIDTPVGPVRIAVTQADHIHVEGKGSSNHVRGRPVYFSAHLYFRHATERDIRPDPNGGDYHYDAGQKPVVDSPVEWRLGEDDSYKKRDSLYAKRDHPSDDATKTQRKVIEDAIVPAVNAYMAEHPELVRLARIAHANNALASLEAEIEKLRLELGKKIEASHTLLATLSDDELEEMQAYQEHKRKSKARYEAYLQTPEGQTYTIKEQGT